jgi:hypothetical protein
MPSFRPFLEFADNEHAKLFGGNCGRNTKWRTMEYCRCRAMGVYYSHYVR